MDVFCYKLGFWQHSVFNSVLSLKNASWIDFFRDKFFNFIRVNIPQLHQPKTLVKQRLKMACFRFKPTCAIWLIFIPARFVGIEENFAKFSMTNSAAFWVDFLHDKLFNSIKVKNPQLDHPKTLAKNCVCKWLVSDFNLLAPRGWFLFKEISWNLKQFLRNSLWRIRVYPE